MSSARFVGQLCRHFLADRGGLVTLLKVYMDEAGTDAKSPVLTVAGYAARPSQWMQFTKEWNSVLRPTGIKVYHATDAQACQEEFKGWDDLRVIALAKQLLPIIPKYASGLAISIEMRDFNEAMSHRPDLKPLFGNPYAACFHWFVAVLLKWTREHDDAKVRFALVHETNSMKKDAIAAYDWLKEFVDNKGRLVSLSFADKGEFIPLQAADILAFEVGKRIANQGNRERLALTALNPGGSKVNIKFYDKKNMAELIKAIEAVSALRSLASQKPLS